ncbi:MAG: hypothetical protein A3K19_02950 [Lentisphaerae bacterium RIFOXYB12_FULL_65_16]|nr:MAG: hypothetical protein A3K18_20000 [Lentisphaerae bacterium RIFOXYA12_64_32]OGV92310.1 MAG: hypothetical protein A3K19_02950 [Lentisphaerae bacterium RIFOXYB12_FULL_65_16]
MSASVIAQELLKDFDVLPVDRQRMVLEFVHFLAGAGTPPGTPGKSLLRFAGVLDEQDARAMSEAVARECERVDSSEW